MRRMRFLGDLRSGVPFIGVNEVGETDWGTNSFYLLVVIPFGYLQVMLSS